LEVERTFSHKYTDVVIEEKKCDILKLINELINFDNAYGTRAKRTAAIGDCKNYYINLPA